MLRNPPLGNNFPILQSFGDNPAGYADVTCGGVALRGHNGIDYGTPVGTPVLAIQNGAALEVGDDPDGFGRYVVLGHQWGQSLYAHLDQVSVAQGQSVAAGDQIGLSGNTGKTSQPHLHFGMRVNPFTVEDGWCGYVDPAPYLARLTEPLGAIMGPHIVGGVHKHLNLLRTWKPRALLVLDPNPDEMRELRAVCPDTVIIGRVFATDHEIDNRIRNDPQEAAQWAHGKTMERMSPDVDYWQFANEVLQKEDSLPLLNQFELARMALAEANGYKCAIFAFSVGNPDLPEDDRMALWELVYPAIEQAEENGHIIALHQYGMPDLWGPEGLTDWLIYRLEHQVLSRLPYKKVKFAVTEYGIDGLIQQPSAAGWQKFTDAEGYTEQLLKSGRYVERFMGRILGYAVYTLGHNPPWGSYDIEGDVANMLATRSQRGTWNDVSIVAVGLGPDMTDSTTDPGGSGTSDTGTSDNDTSDNGTVPDDNGENTNGEDPDVNGSSLGGGESESGGTDQPGNNGEGETMQPTIERRISEWVDHYNMQIKSLDQRPDNPDPDSDVVYEIKDVFTTYMGSWEPSDQPGSVPQWARDDYLTAEFLEAGADHHLFGAVIGRDGQFIKNMPVTYWSDGFDRLGDPEYDGYIHEKTKESSGWANMFMASGSSFVPERGESGPWCWMPDGASEVMCGGGLPANHHLSTFVVWQEVVRKDDAEPVDPGSETTDPGGSDPGDGDPDSDEPGVIDPGAELPETGDETTDPEDGDSTEPGIVDPGGEVTDPDDGDTTDPDTETPGGGTTEPGDPTLPFERRISSWAEAFNLTIKGLGEAPVPADADVVYRVKDIFTTHNGSWEPGNDYGSVPQWARDDYLKPFGAPDYFDDAGGDHHLFAAVLGLDGEPMRKKEIVYWSDGFDSVNDPGYTGFVDRETKEHSGWINIPVGPGSSYVPERGERGPWCWMPTGGSEVVCGGGLPAKNHISTFVVWQAVKREDGGTPSVDKDDFNIFFPSIQSSRPQPAAAAAPVQAEDSAESSQGDAVRQSAWGKLGLGGSSNSDLAAYARANKLGMPVTEEYNSAGYRAQGFQFGIVYQDPANPSDIRHMPW